MVKLAIGNEDCLASPSYAELRVTKSELIENLSEDGKAAINLDDPWLAGLEPRLGPRAVTYLLRGPVGSTVSLVVMA